MDENEGPPRSAVPMSEPSAAHVALTAAIESADRVVNQAAAMRLQLVLQQFDCAVLDEQAAGREVVEGGAFDRAFAMHVATALTLSRRTACGMIARGLLLRDELPRTFAAFAAGACTQAQAFAAADAVAGLDPEQTARFDSRAAALVGTVPDAQLGQRLKRLRVHIAPDAAIERARLAAANAGVTASPHRDGMGALRLRTTSAVVAGVYDGLYQSAVKAHGRAGETRSFQELLAATTAEAIVKGLGLGALETDVPDPATPSELLGTAEQPGTGRIQAQIVVLVPAATAAGQSDEPAALAGMGAIDADQARHVVAVSRSWTRAEVDPITDAILGFDSHDRYIPTALRKLILTRQPTCGCGCGQPSHRVDLDHVVRVEHDGRTRHTNLQGLCRTSHAWLKDGRFMDVRLQPDGSIRWRDRWGGTRIEQPLFRIRAREAAAAAEPCPY